MPDPLPRRPGTLLAVVLLAMSSGLLDAVVYIRHGQVFANAMTGNLVLLGVAFLSRDHVHILQHLVPLAGFLLGVCFGKYLLRRHRRASLHLALLFQILVLAAAGSFADRLSFSVLVSFLAFSGAVIITVVRRIGSIPFNITFMTGNLRAVAEGAFDTIFPPLPEFRDTSAARQFQVVGLTCFGFLLGAVAGAFGSAILEDRSFFLSDGLLLAAGILLRDTRNPSD